jgi:outer membrane lipoprotein carrier protein
MKPRFALAGAIACAWLALGTLSHPSAALEPTAAEVARALQQKYDTVRDFSANFVQSYTGGVLKKTLDERGKLLVKKPGKMRWDYASPDTKQFVSNGDKTYFYVPADKQVYVASLPADDSISTRILFLAGKGNIVRDFTASFVPLPARAPAGSRALKLVPKNAQADFEWLMLFVDPETLALRGLASTDAQGGTSSFSFTNVKENTGVSDKLFDFAMPRGVEVIHDGR